MAQSYPASRRFFSCRHYLLLLLALLPLTSTAQDTDSVPVRRQLYGFYVEPALTLNKAKGTLQAEATPGFAFGAGLHLYYTLNNSNAMFRGTVGINFAGDKVTFRDQADKKVVNAYTSDPLTLGLHPMIKLKDNGSLYLVLGTSSYLDLFNQEEHPKSEYFGYRRFNQSLDIGLAKAIPIPFATFLPELRYSHGLLDMQQAKDNELGAVLESFYRHRLSLYLSFF